MIMMVLQKELRKIRMQEEVMQDIARGVKDIWPTTSTMRHLADIHSKTRLSHDNCLHYALHANLAW